MEQYFCRDDGIFPNSHLPVVLYRQVLALPYFFAAGFVEKLFAGNNWKNCWKDGIFTYQHYHSITHEVMGAYKGRTKLLIGGPERGFVINIAKGDVLILPAGVAHMNLMGKNSVQVVGAYPDGMQYDLNFGRKGERPTADENIRSVPLPDFDPVEGENGELLNAWKQAGANENMYSKRRENMPSLYNDPITVTDKH